MYEYKYHIDLQYLDVKTSTLTKIPQESIKSLIIVSDYNNAYLPKLLLSFNIDKNLADNMILNSSTNLINLSMYKMKKDNEIKEVYFRNQFKYFPSDDINYNKDIDYPKDNPEGDDKKVYKELTLGLLQKESITQNKKTLNGTLINTTLMNTVLTMTNHMNILIEPFTYTSTLQQLIIPPMDSLSETLKFLNEINVFYDTPYRYFIDKGITYLVSTSGVPTKRRNELYSSVIIQVHKITDSKSMIPGIEEDEANKCYKLDISVADTSYSTNKINENTYGKIIAILDTSKERARSLTSALSKAKDQMQGFMDKLNNIANNKIDQIRNIPKVLSNSVSRVYTNTYEIEENRPIYTKNYNGALDGLDMLISHYVVEMNTPPAGGGGDGGGGDGGGGSSRSFLPPTDGTPTESGITVEEYVRRIALVEEVRKKIIFKNDAINVRYAKVPQLPEGLVKVQSKIITNLTDVTNIQSNVNGIMPENSQDNLKNIRKEVNNLNTNNVKIKEEISNELIPFSNDINNIPVNMKAIYNDLMSIPDVAIFATTDDEDSESEVEGGAGSISIFGAIIREYANGISNESDKNGVLIGDITNIIRQTDTHPDVVSSITKAVQPVVVSMGDIGLDLKAQLADFSSLTSNLLSEQKTLINKLKESSMTIVEDISSGQLGDIKTNINSVLSLENVGRLGISNFEIDTVFKDLHSGILPSKSIRILNDNPNKIKNIKASIETANSILNINKMDVDASIFTINKEYIVKNYNSHNDKDGRFILSKKTEIFLNSGPEFSLNLNLELKIAPESSKNKKAST